MQQKVLERSTILQNVQESSDNNVRENASVAEFQIVLTAAVTLGEGHYNWYVQKDFTTD